MDDRFIADQWKQALGLLVPSKSGFHRQTYRSGEEVDTGGLPSRFAGSRVFSTAIYFLLESGEFFAFHRIKQDEVWFFHTGVGIVIHQIDEQGKYAKVYLGVNLNNGETPQTVVPAGYLFAVSVPCPERYPLVGCNVAPGFEFDDFEMPSRRQLVARYPEHRGIIGQLTRPYSA
jgi:predicted cupin superfamily sugar epimerase